MSIVEPGKEITISYRVRTGAGKLHKGSDKPITYAHGKEEELLSPIEKALIGKKVGDEVEVPMTAAQAFGEYDKSLVFTDHMSMVPEETREVGATFEAKSKSGNVVQFRVTRVQNDQITINGNHPLAGQDVTFLVKVEEIGNPPVLRKLDS